MLATLLRQKRSTTTPPASSSLTPASTSPSRAVLGVRPVATITASHSILPPPTLASSVPSARRAMRDTVLFNRMRTPFLPISSCTRQRRQFEGLGRGDRMLDAGNRGLARPAAGGDEHVLRGHPAPADRHGVGIDELRGALDHGDARPGERVGIDAGKP